MLSLRAHALVCGGLFAALIGIAIGGNILAAIGLVHDLGAARLPFLILIFGLFVAFGFSAIPVMVKLVYLSGRAAGAAVPPGENRIIWALWSLMAAGLAIGLPAAIHDGLFDTDATAPPAAAAPGGAAPIVRPDPTPSMPASG